MILRPMTVAEFDQYKQVSIPEYATEKVKSGDWSEAESLDISSHEFNRELPEGLNTSDHFLCTLVTESNQLNVGILWYAIEQRADHKVAFIYDISIHPQHRRQGHATRALTALEAKTKAAGIKSIGLNVFGFNAQAYDLYKKFGFKPASIRMYKTID